MILTDIRGFNYEDDEFLHGFHIDTSSDVSDFCRHTGRHYNPHGVRHGEPLFGERLGINLLLIVYINIQ